MYGGFESDGWLVGIKDIDTFLEDGPSMMPNNKYIIQIPQINKWLDICIMWRSLCAHCGPGILKKPLAIKFKVITIEAQFY